MSRTDYHLGELAIALDKSHPGHVLPPVPANSRQILDVGCGMGQTLLALNLAPDVIGWSVDPDVSAIEAGRKLMPPNVHLVAARANHLPFRDGTFDFCYSRVALPYMDIKAAIREMARILRPGGELWMVLHSWRVVIRRLNADRRRGDLKDFAFCLYVVGNSLLFHLTNRQITGNHQETFQTEYGIRHALRSAGFEGIEFTHDTFFIVHAVKVHEKQRLGAA
jgi:ubiquinone/menaquinone biosynthesis C-methylase UbiE